MTLTGHALSMLFVFGFGSGYNRRPDPSGFRFYSAQERSMITNNGVSMPSRAWYGDNDLPLAFPAGWTVEMVGPRDAPKLPAGQIEAAFARPIGTAPLRDLARGRRSAAIVVDDLSRPTPADQILPYVLRELAEAGIPRHEIRIVVGGGSHRPLTGEEIVKKVGAEVAAAYEVSSHDFMSGDLRGLGNLPSGLPIYLDRRVVEADFKLCLGGVYPHGSVGFGGGAKLILPGVAGFATIFYFHTHYAARGHAVIENNTGVMDHRDAAEAVARRLGLDAIVNVVINSRREVAGLFVGDFVQAHRAAARFALDVYGTPISEAVRGETDLVVTNCYPLDSDALQTGKALWMRGHFPKAYTIAVNPACDGICYHGLYSRMDWARYGQQAVNGVEEPMAQVGTREQPLVWSEKFPRHEFAEKIKNGILFRHWEPLIAQLAERLPRDARVAVFPCGGIQVLAEEDEVQSTGHDQVSISEGRAA
jgi:lactate racemase